MYTFSLAALVTLAAGATTQASGGGLTLGKVLADVPHDAAAFVVYAMVIGSVVFVWRSGRSRSAERPGD